MMKLMEEVGALVLQEIKLTKNGNKKKSRNKKRKWECGKVGIS